MPKGQGDRTILRFAGQLLLSLGVAAALAALFALLTHAWDPRGFATGFFLAAILALLLAGSRLTGRGATRGEFYPYGESAGQERPSAGIRRDFLRAFSDDRFVVQMVLLAALCFALSLLVELFP